MSLPEVLLWKQLKNGALEGLRFRRQHPAGPYILDFYCDEVRLAVEVDGLSHSMGDAPGWDERRDIWLAARGIRVLRISAHLVLKEMDGALRMILAEARGEPLPPLRGYFPQRGKIHSGPTWARTFSPPGSPWAPAVRPPRGDRPTPAIPSSRGGVRRCRSSSRPPPP